MILESHLHGGPWCIQACRDAQLYGIYEVPLLLPDHLKHLIEPMMEELRNSHAVRTAKRSAELRQLLAELEANPNDFDLQARVSKIKEELELEALENQIETH